MTGRYLLDTNILIAFFGNDPKVQQCLGQAEEVFVPAVALGELYYGGGCGPDWPDSGYYRRPKGGPGGRI